MPVDPLPVDPATRRAIRRDALSVGVATGAYGLSFGAAAVTAGLSTLQACLLSLLLFSGASQFALVAAIGAGGGLTGVAGVVLLGARNALYGLRLAPLLGVRGPRRLGAALVVIDETAAMAASRSDPVQARVAFWSTAVAVYTFWNAATLLGALGATRLGDPAVLGLDAAVPAAFLALIAPRLRARDGQVVAVIAAVLAAAAVPLTPPGVPVLVAVLALGPVLLTGRRDPGPT